MDEEGESIGYGSSPGGSGHAFLPPLKERARRERRPAARPDRPGTVIEATSQGNSACSQGALRQKGTPCAAAMCCFESLRHRFDAMYSRNPLAGVQAMLTGNAVLSCAAANLPSSGRKGDRLRWKEPAGDFMANSHDVIPAFPVDGEGGPRERWMRSRRHQPKQTPKRLRAGFFAFAKRTRKESPASRSPALPAGYRHRSHNQSGTCLLKGRAFGKKAHPAPPQNFALRQILCNSA